MDGPTDGQNLTPLFPLCSTSEQNGKRRQMEAADPPGAQPKKKQEVRLRSHKHTRAALSLPLFSPSFSSSPLFVPSLPHSHIAVSQKAADMTHYLQRRPCCWGSRGEGVDGRPSFFFFFFSSRGWQMGLQNTSGYTEAKPSLLPGELLCCDGGPRSVFTCI